MYNETNITIDVARILINSQTETNNFCTFITESGITIISILITGFIAYYGFKSNTRNIFIQSNETKINEAITELSELIDRGQPKEIRGFLNSSKGIYIPVQIKSKIRVLTKGEINKEIKNKMLDSISKYLSP